MRCNQCHRDNRDEARFCRACGTTLYPSCTACGTRLEAGSLFCDRCGASVSTPGSWPPVMGSAVRTPGHIAEKILLSKAALEGERKQLSVLFADLKGSTEHIADLDPDHARRLLDPVLERMMEAVYRYEGTVNQVMGDGIMALFGAPLALEDHAIRACHAALRMQEIIKAHAGEVFRTEGVPLEIRVGLNSGEVIVRSIGSDLHMNYTAMGLTTHLAARMEQVAAPGSIYMTARTLRLVEGYVAVRPLGALYLKGVTEPVETHELLGAIPRRTRLRATPSRDLTPFAGRDVEMKLLRQALDHAEAGQGQVVAIVGEPGTGKSRVIHEFVHSEAKHGLRVLEASAESFGMSTSYLAVTELLRHYFQIGASETPDAIRERVTRKLAEVDESLMPLLAPLLALLDPAIDTARTASAPSPASRRRMLDAVQRLLFAENMTQPLLLVLEDLHSIDPESQALIDGLVDGLSAARFMLLVSYRPEYQHGWSNKPYYTQVRIDPLGPAAAGKILDSLVGTGAGLEPLKQLVITKTGCNPLFLEESVKSLVETGVLAGPPGAYRAAKPVSDFPAPVTLDALLTSRIDRLAEMDKRVLQSAAVVGNPADLRVLEALGEFRPDEVRQALERLQALEFLYETSPFPGIEYTFKHALLHDAAYRMLSPDRRRDLHNAALAAGEELNTDSSSEKAEWLAFHAFRAEMWDKAVKHLQTAATRAIARSANRVAVEHLENALIAAAHLPKPDRTSVALDLRIDLRHAVTPLGQVQRTLHHLEIAEQLATKLDDRSRLGRVVSFTANCLVLLGRYEEALTTGARALEIAREIGDQRLELMTYFYVARATRSLGRYSAAIATYREVALGMDDRLLDDFLILRALPESSVRSQLAVTLAEVGDFDEAEAQAAEALRRSTASEQPDPVMWSHWGTGMVLLLRGNAGEAAGIFNHLLNLCRAHDLDAYISRVTAALGCAKARSGQVADGLQLLREAVSLDRSAEPRTTHAFALAALAEASLLAGYGEKALSHVTESLRQTEKYRERGEEAYARWLLATIMSVIGEDFEAARNAFEDAASLAAELGLKPLLAHCYLGLGDLDERCGGTRSSHRERGLMLLETLRMRQWIDLSPLRPAALRVADRI
jgi:class 3 adenylate cyclase/tetratricopeptide (TPR) repeat protein